MKLKLLALFLLLSLPAFSFADRPRGTSWYVDPRTVPDNQVEFWKSIFTKYGEDQFVFHYRDYPNLVYSVVDVSDLKARYGRTRRFEQLRTVRLNQELSKIRGSLQHLANGGSARSLLERKIAQSFARVAGGRAKYQRALMRDQVRFQSGIKERFREGLVHSTRYLWLMEKIFREEGLPVELTRLPFVESCFNYNAYSAVGAAGIWQFMPATARSYMLINSQLDERRDPIIATRAAAKYLGHAYRRIGDWPLAITSYNHGVTGVLRAVKAAGRRDLKAVVERYSSPAFGFASKNFYSEFAAALEVERNYKKYFPGLRRDNPLRFDEIRMTQALPLSRIAQSAGLSRQEFLELNPALLKPVRLGYSAVPRGAIVRLPENKSGVVLASLRSGSQVPQNKASQLFTTQFEARKASGLMAAAPNAGIYRVKSGDTLGQIARRHSVSLSQIMIANSITNPKYLSVGKNLLIPGQKTASYRLARNTSGAASRIYVVKPGDSLYGIARNYGLKLSQIEQLNPAAGRMIKPGQKLSLP